MVPLLDANAIVMQMMYILRLLVTFHLSFHVSRAYSFYKRQKLVKHTGKYIWNLYSFFAIAIFHCYVDLVICKLLAPLIMFK